MASRHLQHVTAIRPARPEELTRLGPLYVRSGFDARLARVVGFARARLGGEVFVAAADGELAGVAAGAWFGATGWVGGVAVVPERRRAGLGGALTEAVVAHLQGSGAGTVLLHATEVGRPVYQRLGFLAEAEYLTLAGPPLSAAGPAGGGGAGLDPGGGYAAGGPNANGVRAGRAGDLAAVSALDRQATGEDRARLLTALWPAGGLVAGEQDAAFGFHLASPWRPGGATVAADPEAGLTLLQAARRVDTLEVSVSVPDGNQAARQALAAAGFLERSRTTRMHLGPPVPWRPAALFGCLTLFWG
jgi:GNAT superfamily N-acetyltransferase